MLPGVLAFAVPVPVRVPVAAGIERQTGIERQRRSTTKPRVGARHERLPWVPIRQNTNPNGVAQQKAGLAGMTNDGKRTTTIAVPRSTGASPPTTPVSN
jgi:hypothetical protein